MEECYHIRVVLKSQGIVREVLAAAMLSGGEPIGNEACLHSNRSLPTSDKIWKPVLLGNTTTRLQMSIVKQLCKPENDVSIHTYSMELPECFPTDQ